MTNESCGRHWLEEAIGNEREPQRILESITTRPEFRDAIGEAVAVSQRTSNTAKQTRIIAEHIVRVLYRRFNGFVALH